MSDFNWKDYPTEAEQGFSWESFPEEEPSQGFSGVAKDIGGSIGSLPEAISSMIMSLPGEAYASGEQILTNPSRAGKNLAGGSLKGIREFANIPSNIREYLLEKDIPMSKGNPYPKFEPSSLENSLIGGEQQEGDALLRGLTQFMSPYSRIGAGMNGAKGLATRGAGAGLMGVADEEMDPIHASLIGMLGEGTGKSIRKAGEFAAEHNPLSQNKNNLIKGIEPSDVSEGMAASKRLGLSYVTPGEASGFGYIGKQEGKIGNTLEGSKLREKRAKERKESEEAVINNFLYKLDDKVELPKEKQKLYEEVNKEILPDKFLGSYITNNYTVQDAVKMAETKAAYKDKLKDVPKNSFEYWNQIKRILFDMGEAQKRKGNLDLGTGIDSIRHELVNEMDSINPRFKQARKLSERSILRRQIEKGFDKKEMTGHNFYKNVIESKDNFKKLYEDLSEFPDMQQQLQDMRTVFPNLYGQGNAKGAVQGERKGYETPRADFAFIGRLLKQYFNERGDVKAVQALTSPEWHETLLSNQAQAGKQGAAPRIDQLIQHLIKAQSGRDQEYE